jgi:hypothetical protein
MKPIKSLAFTLLAVALVLAACGTTGTQTPVATVRSMVLPTLTIHVSTPAPTSTPRPTSTFDPFAAATSTSSSSTLMASFTQTHSFSSTEVSQFPPFPPDCISYWSGIPRYRISPDGEWIASTDCYLPDPTLIVWNRSGTSKWELHYWDYSPYKGEGYVYIQHWSKDSRYLYFSTASFGDGGLCFYGYDGGGFGLFRLDLKTGVIVSILPLRDEIRQYFWSFSPTGRRFVYIQNYWTPGVLNIWDLYTGEVSSIPLESDIEEIGGFLWSDEGVSVAFTTLHNMDGKQDHYELYLADTITGSIRVLMVSPITRCIRAVSWASKNVLNVEVDEPNHIYSQIEIDITSTQAVTTPTP